MSKLETITVAATPSDRWSKEELVLPKELGPVSLLREIGRGGRGVVYLGHHRVLNRNVAVKFLVGNRSTVDDPAFTQFIDGIRAAAAVQHPHLTAVYHADVFQDVAYLVMAYVEGPTVAELLDRHGPMPLKIALSILVPTSDAVAALHQKNIVHRDIKPRNVLVDSEGGVFVTDFGLASEKSALTLGERGTLLAGTPAYMAPELFEGAVSPRSDVYALGVMSYELLTAGLPFTGSLDHVRAQHCEAPLPMDSLIVWHVNERMIEVIQRAMHKNPLFRYKSAAHFLKAVENLGPILSSSTAGSQELGALVRRSLDEPHPSAVLSVPKKDSSSYQEALGVLAEAKRCRSGEDESGADVESLLPAMQDPLRRVIAHDIPCIRCAYNLRSLPPDQSCPECGSPLAESLDPSRLIFADAALLKRICFGLSMIVVWAIRWPLAVWVVSGGIWSISLFQGRRPDISVSAFIWFIWYIATLLAVPWLFWITSQPRTGSRRMSWNMIPLMIVAGWALTLAIIALVSGPSRFNTPLWRAPSPLLASGLVMGTTYLFLTRYLIKLSSWLQDASQARLARLAFSLSVAPLTLIVLLSATHYLPSVEGFISEFHDNFWTIWMVFILALPFIAILLTAWVAGSMGKAVKKISKNLVPFDKLLSPGETLSQQSVDVIVASQAPV